MPIDLEILVNASGRFAVRWDGKRGYRVEAPVSKLDQELAAIFRDRIVETNEATIRLTSAELVAALAELDNVIHTTEKERMDTHFARAYRDLRVMR